MKYSNVNFLPLRDGSIVANKTTIGFTNYYNNEVIPVNKESKKLICIGNKGKNKVKLQFTVQNDYRIEIRINPEVVTIGKWKACEFEIFIKSLCTYNVEDNVLLSSLDLNKVKFIIIGIKASKEITTI